MISYLWMVMNWKTNLPRHSHKFGLIWHRIIPKKIQRFFCNNKLIFHIGKSINYTSGFQFCLLFSAKKKWLFKNIHLVIQWLSSLNKIVWMWFCLKIISIHCHKFQNQIIPWLIQNSVFNSLSCSLWQWWLCDDTGLLSMY